MGDSSNIIVCCISDVNSVFIAMNLTKKQLDTFLEHAEDHTPWVEYTQHWKNESAYFTWLRGQLRRMWQHWPPRNELKASKRVKVKVLDANGKQKLYKSGKKKGKPVTRYELPCSSCGEMHSQANVEADHLEPAGSCSNSVEACTFMYRLLVSADKLRLVCKPCHKIITYAEKMNISFEEAKFKKEIIEIMKKKVDKQKEELLGYGFTESEVKNKELRTIAYTKLLKEGDLK